MPSYDTFVSFTPNFPFREQGEGKVIFRYKGGDILVRHRRGIYYCCAGQYTVTRKVEVRS